MSEGYQSIIHSIYAKYNPAKVEDVPELLKKYKGKEKELLELICEKYNISEQELNKLITAYNDAFPKNKIKGKQGFWVILGLSIMCSIIVSLYYSPVKHDNDANGNQVSQENAVVQPLAETPNENIEKTTTNNAEMEVNESVETKFWKVVQTNIEYKQINDGAYSWLFKIAQNLSGNSYSEALSRLENIENDNLLQDKIFLELYIAFHNSRESLRMVLNNMCNSYALANPISDIILNKYANDNRAIQIINAKEVNTQFQNNEDQVSIKEKEVAPIIETEAEFPGGEESLFQFIAKNIKYPPKAKRNNIEGKVLLTFIVNSEGDIENITIKNGIGGGCDEEAIRVVKLMPKWKSGTQNGRPVSSTFSLPINFSLTEEE